MLEGFSDVLASSRLQSEKSEKNHWAPPPEIAGDIESTGEETEELDEVLQLEIEPSHNSLNELLSEISLPELGKIVMNFYSTG